MTVNPYLEYLPLRLGVALVDTLPLGAALALGRAVGVAAYRTMPRRRKLAQSNILAAGCAADSRAADIIAKKSFQSFGMVAIESLAASRIITAENVDAHTELVWPEASRALIDEPGRPVVLAVPHLGNWEVSGHIASFHKKLVAVARNMDNPLVQRFMLRRNPRRNIEIVGKHSGGAALLRPLKNGHLLALVCDQHASGSGVVCDFLGRPAKTITSPARLHLSTRAPLICACCVRIAPMKFRAIVSEPLDRTGATVPEITAEINARLGAYIRDYPEQYLWSHNRWRV